MPVDPVALVKEKIAFDPAFFQDRTAVAQIRRIYFIDTQLSLSLDTAGTNEKDYCSQRQPGDHPW
jgi:hypothetical protein